MKVNELKIKVDRLCKVIGRNPVVPSLEDILIQEGMMHTSNLKVNYSTPCSLSVDEVLVPAKRFKALLSTLPSTSAIDLRKDKDDGVEVYVDGVRKATYSKLTDPMDFPKIPKPEKAAGTLRCEDVPRLQSMVPFVSKDELRPAMTTVYMNGLFAATDSHRLIYKNHVSNVLEKELLIDVLVPELMDAQDYEIWSDENSNWINFSDGMNNILFRNMDEIYPNIQNVIPVKEDYQRIVTIDRKTLVSELKQAVVFANTTTHQVALGFEKSFHLSVSCENIDFPSDFYGSIPASIEKSENVEWEKIGFNAKFLLSAINVNSKLPTVNISFVKPGKPAIIDDMVLVMPIMLNSFS